jgi:GNAT superfamily N-acetyltransferase
MKATAEMLVPPGAKGEWVVERQGRPRLALKIAGGGVEEGVRYVDGRYQITNHVLKVDPSRQGEGIGARMLAREVHFAAQRGFKLIATSGVRDDNPEDPARGYWVWPAMGFDVSVGNMPTALSDKVGKAFPSARSLQDVLATPGGLGWWKENGGDVELQFDPTPGSRSRKVLDAYIKRRFRKDGKIRK